MHITPLSYATIFSQPVVSRFTWFSFLLIIRSSSFRNTSVYPLPLFEVNVWCVLYYQKIIIILSCIFFSKFKFVYFTFKSLKLIFRIQDEEGIHFLPMWITCCPDTWITPPFPWPVIPVLSGLQTADGHFLSSRFCVWVLSVCLCVCPSLRYCHLLYLHPHWMPRYFLSF